MPRLKFSFHKLNVNYKVDLKHSNIVSCDMLRTLVHTFISLVHTFISTGNSCLKNYKLTNKVSLTRPIGKIRCISDDTKLFACCEMAVTR